MVIVPLRTDGSTLRATVNESVALPCPVVESPSLIQASAAAAAHSQSRLVVMPRVPAPPSTWNDEGVAVTLRAHFDVDVDGDVIVCVDELHAADAVVIDTDNTNMSRDMLRRFTSPTAMTNRTCRTATRCIPAKRNPFTIRCLRQ